jgi:hypothetical protein
MPDFTNVAGFQVQQLGNLEASPGFQSWTVSTPALPGASGTAVANSLSTDAIVVLVGGTVSVVGVSPNGTGGTFVTKATATGTAVLVPAAGAIKLTYSAAPTAWYWLTSALSVSETDK